MYRSTIESVGVFHPAQIIDSNDLLKEDNHKVIKYLQKITGIEERRFCSPSEDSYSLAIQAANNCLANSKYESEEIEMLISCSISKYDTELNYRFDPPVSFIVRNYIGSTKAIYYDISNACSGMITGVYILNNYIKRGIIQRGMVVSGEYISSIHVNALNEVKNFDSSQLSSLTVGDAGAAVILSRVKDEEFAIMACEMSTYSEYSNLCIGKACDIGPGAVMHTEAKKLHRAAIDNAHHTILKALNECQTKIQDIDWLIPHQTAKWAIKDGIKNIGRRIGGKAKNTIYNLAEYGNTASTTHFVALHKYLLEKKINYGDRVLLLTFASGLVCGCLIFRTGKICHQY